MTRRLRDRHLTMWFFLAPTAALVILTALWLRPAAQSPPAAEGFSGEKGAKSSP